MMTTAPASTEDNRTLDALRDYILDVNVRAAFDLLLTVENFEAVPQWAAFQGTGPGGQKRVVFRRSHSTDRIYSIAVTQRWLWFHIRKPGWSDEWRHQLRAHPDRFEASPGRDWRAKVRNVDEVRFIVELSKQTPHRIRLAK